MTTHRLELTLDDNAWERLNEARGHEPRASFVKRALVMAIALGESPHRSEEAKESLRRVWESPELERVLREAGPVLDAVAPEPSSGKGKVSRPVKPADDAPAPPKIAPRHWA